ncbi:hypothetical protein BX600DRAFT_509338 [Xylariales sp. PMI_506]|nr:hypothetical protein BX600DRAFT_509338 [Xylariales sp. PMI_506]
MTFTFVDNAARDRETRRLIRSQAAKGRNIGKGRPRRKPRPAEPPTPRSRPGKSASPSTSSSPSSAAADPISPDECRTWVATVDRFFNPERQIDDGGPLVLPYDLPPRSRILFRKVFTFLVRPFHVQEMLHAVDIRTGGHLMWVQFLFMDEAYFHCSAALCNLCSGMRLMGSDGATDAMHHMDQTFRIVNKRLSGNQALSDLTVAAVMAMSQYERISGNYDRTKVHFEGMQQIVELSGGIVAFIEKHAAFAQKIFRADLELALYLGLPTTFPLEVIPGHSTICWMRERYSHAAGSPLHRPDLLSRLSVDMGQMLLDMTNMATMLSGKRSKGPVMVGYVFHNLLIHMGYRLVSINPLGGPLLNDPFENLLHLGLITFLASFLVGLNREIPYFAILADLIRFSAMKYVACEQREEEMLLWILFMGRATNTLKEADETWVLPKARSLMPALDLHTWDDAARSLSRLPWVASLHEKAGRTMWARIISSGTG